MGVGWGVEGVQSEVTSDCFHWGGFAIRGEMTVSLEEVEYLLDIQSAPHGTPRSE